MVKSKIAAFSIAVFISTVVALAASQARAGTISGQVHVQGLPSAAGVMVYLNKAPKVNEDFSKGHFVMDQQNLTFIPHVLVVPVGGTVEFPNNDKVKHNVFSLSSTKKFNLGSYGPGQSKSVTFDKPGIVELRCDVHAEMIAYIMVVKNPYVAVTDASGHFQIPDPQWARAAGLPEIPALAAGEYSVKLWHAKLRPVREKVHVPAQGNVTVDLSARRGPTGSVLYK